MDITINLADGMPIYRQIANQIRYMVASRILKSDDEVPSIRSLALRLKVTPNTVVKAYDELEAAGILAKRHGSGTFVTGTRRPVERRERKRIIEERIDALLAEAHQLGYSEDQLLAVIRRRQSALDREPRAEEADERMVG